MRYSAAESAEPPEGSNNMKEQEPVEETEKLFTRVRSRRYGDWIRIGVHLAVIAVFLVLFFQRRLDRLENIVLDEFWKYSSFSKVHPAVAMIEISNEALSEIGEWPWPRHYHAVIARLLDQWGAAAVVFDYNFPGETLSQEDQDLLQALQKLKAPFYLPLDLRPKKEKKFWLHGLPVVLDKNEGKTEWGHSPEGFEKIAKALGHHQLTNDPDGTLRRFAPYLSDGTETVPFLALPAAYDFLKEKLPEESDLREMGGPDGQVLIPWIDGWRDKFARYDFAGLIHSFYGIQKGMRLRSPSKHTWRTVR